MHPQLDPTTAEPWAAQAEPPSESTQFRTVTEQRSNDGQPELTVEPLKDVLAGQQVEALEERIKKLEEERATLWKVIALRGQ